MSSQNCQQEQKPSVTKLTSAEIQTLIEQLELELKDATTTFDFSNYDHGTNYPSAGARESTAKGEESATSEEDLSFSPDCFTDESGEDNEEEDTEEGEDPSGGTEDGAQGEERDRPSSQPVSHKAAEFIRLKSTATSGLDRGNLQRNLQVARSAWFKSHAKVAQHLQRSEDSSRPISYADACSAKHLHGDRLVASGKPKFVLLNKNA